MEQEDLEWSGERLETFVFNQSTIEHLHRYGMVMPLIENKVVLDIACGEGYGSNLMAEKALNVTGVDIDATAVKKAEKKYKRPNLEFKHGSADQIPMPDGSVDVVVSFETIEHHDKHHEMMREIKRVLKPDGVMVMSSPEKTGDVSVNHFHVKELTQEEFKELVGAYFKFQKLYTQKTIHGSFICPTEPRPSSFEYLTGDFKQVHAHDNSLSYEFNVVIANDVKELYLPYSFFDGKEVLLKSILHPYKNSRLYKFGLFIKKITGR